ncbi:MAG: hypothetical protein WD342_02070 [Verrucomicrobiales bacterium]
MKTNTQSNTQSNSTPMLFAGIDYHKRYSVVHVLDADGATVKKGRVAPNSLGGFAGFFSGFPAGSVRAVFESSMNWGYLWPRFPPFSRFRTTALAVPPGHDVIDRIGIFYARRTGHDTRNEPETPLCLFSPPDPIHDPTCWKAPLVSKPKPRGSKNSCPADAISRTVHE